MLDILCIGAHPDDVEIGMGGSILNFKSDGFTVGILDITDGEPTPVGSHEKRIQESIRAKELLSIDERVTLDLPNRYLKDSPEGRIKIAEVIRLFKPRILFIPYWIDAHPDHIEASLLSDAARFTAKLTRTEMKGEPFYPQKVFYFFCTHLKMQVKPSFIIDISTYIDKKMEAILSYKSQFYEQGRENKAVQRVRDMGRHWGMLIGREYGEPFLSKEELGFETLRGLIV
ncbi:MAG: bacillithiol biosynthesis deacetylase BshB1 [Nitrospinota bacterium]